MRAVPFYCPYCAEQTIEPVDDDELGDGAYYCSSCDRTFNVRFKGLGQP